MQRKKEHVGTITVSAKPKRGMPIPPNRVHKNRKRAKELARKGRYRIDSRVMANWR